MGIELNHTIVRCSDKWRSADFVTELFGLSAPTQFGRFAVVELANGVSLDFADTSDEMVRQHYAFLVTEEDFTDIYGKIVERGLDHWAGPGRSRPSEINRRDGGRGVYFEDPDGHSLEIITRPYGSDS